MSTLWSLPPIQDETLFSWATRCSLNHSVPIISDDDIVCWERSIAYEIASGSSSLGIEFDFESKCAREFLDASGFSKVDIRLLFSHSDDLRLSPAYRTAFCHKCVLSDVLEKRFPSWRKSWCYIARPYCDQHKCLLRYMNGYSGPDKQWNAFTQLDLGEFMPGRMAGRCRINHGIPDSPARASLALEIQHWVQGIYRTGSDVRDLQGQLVPNRLMRNAIDLMLRVLLAHRTRWTQAGLAKTVFSSFLPPVLHHRLDLQARLAYGALNSVPYERMCALWLIGLIFKVFTSSQSELFGHMIHEAEFTLPADLGGVGEMCGSILIDGEDEQLADLIVGLGVAQILDGEFIEGLTGRQLR